MNPIKLPILACALVASASVASAQTTVITREPARTETVITQEPAPRTVVHERLTLTPVQRKTIYRTIIEKRKTVDTAGPTIEVGARIPEATHLYAIPEPLAVEIPAIKRYRYMVINDHVLLVDPQTSTVAAEID